MQFLSFSTPSQYSSTSFKSLNFWPSICLEHLSTIFDPKGKVTDRKLDSTASSVFLFYLPVQPRNMELQHFSHLHPLIFKEDQDENNGAGVRCYGCMELISGPQYRCNKTTDCRFFLHQKCAELPQEINHCLHPEHPLFLLPKTPLEYKGNCRFDFCNITCHNFIYHCSFCQFDLDIKCAFPPCFSEVETQCYHQLNSILHFSHPHPLILNEEQEGYNDEGVICFGCGQPISGPHYRCTSSNFFLHKRCAELPKEIKHRLHPEHPLLLSAKSRSQYRGTYVCEFCRKDGDGFVYRCSSCEFNLDIKCAFPPCFSEAKISQGQHQFVCLLKSLPFKSSSFTCNFCGTNGDGSPCLCTLCQLIFHQDCSSSPGTINIRQHPHLLTYTYFPEEDESGRPHCGVCQIQFNTGHGGYHCEECNFFAHVNCANEFRATSSEIRTRTNEYVDLSITCTATATEVEHFSHEHKLILVEEDGNNAKCAGCMLSISAPSYGCSPCNFVLHKACMELERKSTLRNCPTTLYSRDDETIDGVFRCDLCFQYCNGFIYKQDEQDWSEDSELMFDVRCGVNLSAGAITHESHEHRLFFTEADGGRCCEGCGNECMFATFRCASCDFTLDLRCAGLPREARHKYDEHPLLLTYIDPNDYQYVCQVCEKERDPKLWFYRCEECDFDAHIECVLREYHPYVKLGNTRMYDFHPHPLALVEKFGYCPGDYPECYTCGKLCDELALECIDHQCNFIVHSGGSRIDSGGIRCRPRTMYSSY